MDPRDRLFGEIAVRLQLLTREQVVTCIEQQVLAPEKRLGEIAVELGWINATEAELVAAQQARLDARRTGTGMQAPVIEPIAQPAAPPAAEPRGRRRGVQAWGAVDDPTKAQIRLPPAVVPVEGAEPEPPPPPAPVRAAASAPVTPAPAAAPSPAPAAKSRERTPSGRTAHTERLPTSLEPPSPPPPAASPAPAAPAPAPAVTAVKGPASRSGTLIAFAAPPLAKAAEPAAPQLLPGDDLFARAVQLAVEHHASDLHLHVGAPPHARLRGALRSLNDAPLSSDDVESVLAEIASAEHWTALEEHGAVELAYEAPGVARLCVSAAREKDGFGLVCRVLPAAPRSRAELGLPERLDALATLGRGLLLCTGPARAGKSCTWGALVGAALQREGVHVVTVEQPIALALPEGAGRASRHALGGTRTTAAALRAALRQDADVLACDALLDAGALEVLLAAAADRLVIATLPAPSVGSALAHLAEALACADRALTNASLARSVRAVIGQRLLPCKRDASSKPATELLVLGPEVAERLGTHSPRELSAAFQAGRAAGSLTLDESIASLVAQGEISLETAKLAAERAEALG